jgi:hypothetical protein
MINSDYPLRCEFCQSINIPVIENNLITNKLWLIYRCQCYPQDEHSMPVERYDLNKINPKLRPD